MKPPMVSVSPSPSRTTWVGCWAEAGRAPPKTEITITASPENDATPFLMTAPSCEKVGTTLLPLYRSHREALNEAIDEHVIDDGERDAGEQGRRHERPPVVHVAAHQRD